jgi:hypothetical protein
MFIATLFAIAMLWNQPKCLSTDEQIKKCDIYVIKKCGIYRHWCILSHKEIMSFAGK